MREKPREIASAERRPKRETPRAPSPSVATARGVSRKPFPSPPFDRTAGGPEQPEPPAASTKVVATSEHRDGDRQHFTPPLALPASTCETETQKQSNTGLDLTNPDAAQSVAGAPLCLLSGLAAQAHVSRAEEP